MTEQEKQAYEAKVEADKAKEENATLPDGSYFEHKEQEEARERQRRRMAFPYPIWVTAAYLILGFMFGMWHPGWIIFLTIPLFYLPDSQRTPIRLLGKTNHHPQGIATFRRYNHGINGNDRSFRSRGTAYGRRECYYGRSSPSAPF